MNRKNTSIVTSAIVVIALGSVVNFGVANAAVRKNKLAAKTAVTIESKQTKANTEIASRISALNALLTRIGQMSKISSEQQGQLTLEIQNDLNQLTTLQSKISADTDPATLKADMQSITKAYRVYALDLPKGRIEASADRVETIVSTMNDLGAKLQVRIATAQTAGTNVTVAQSAYMDFQSKVADAQKQAQAAISAVADLVADNGVASVLQSNSQALKSAAAQIKVATADLSQARKDATTIINGLKSSKITATTPVTK